MCSVAGADMSRKADIIVTEIFDSELLGEGILATMRHAKANLLKVSASIHCLHRSQISSYAYLYHLCFQKF